mmetsp:Transcript_128955/g.412992  ORF Transcript_128955/g.412992 Transcript_128955/m.412992 type:complete len:240 (+) Transcript_128955:178-897(+)
MAQRARLTKRDRQSSCRRTRGTRAWRAAAVGRVVDTSKTASDPSAELGNIVCQGGASSALLGTSPSDGVRAIVGRGLRGGTGRAKARPSRPLPIPLTPALSSQQLPQIPMSAKISCEATPRSERAACAASGRSLGRPSVITSTAHSTSKADAHPRRRSPRRAKNMPSARRNMGPSLVDSPWPPQVSRPLRLLRNPSKPSANGHNSWASPSVEHINAKLTSGVCTPSEIHLASTAARSAR